MRKFEVKNGKIGTKLGKNWKFGVKNGKFGRKLKGLKFWTF